MPGCTTSEGKDGKDGKDDVYILFFSFSKEMQGSGKSPQCKISFSKPPLLGLYLFYFVFILFLRGTVFFFRDFEF